MSINANVFGGQLTVDLTGTGTPAGVVSLTPASIDFGQVQVGTTSAPLPVQAGNSGATAIPINSIAVTPPFAIASNTCGTVSLAANSSCQVLVEFAPTQPGAPAGTLTFTDGAGTQTVALNGTGAAAPTDTLAPLALSFPGDGGGLALGRADYHVDQRRGFDADGDQPFRRAVPSRPRTTAERNWPGRLPAPSAWSLRPPSWAANPAR